MLELEADGQARAERFIERVVRQRVVWGLRCDEGWVQSESSADEERAVMPFWSARAYAARCAAAEWSSYRPTPISLDSFLRNWLPGMGAEGCLVGVDWNGNLCGAEFQPLDLQGKIRARLRADPGTVPPQSTGSEPHGT